MNTELDEFLKKKRKEYIALLKETVEQDTTNPPGNEYLVARIIKKKLDSLRIKYTVHEKEKGRTNIIARVGKPGGKKLLVAAHMDVVPAGDGWKTRPFNPVIKDNKMFGRGVADNKSSLIASLLVLEYLKQYEHVLDGQFIFAAVADEETGSTMGMEFLLKKRVFTKDNVDFAIIPDTEGEMKKIYIAEKGVLNLKVTAHGKQVHGSTPELGVNAIEKMAEFLLAIKDHELKHKKHDYLSMPTINAGSINGGIAANMVPAECECTLNIRYIPGQTPEKIIKELRGIARKIGKFSLETEVYMPPHEVHPHNRFVISMIQNAEKAGIKTRLDGMSGATVAKNLALHGIPAVGFDLNSNDVAHIANEYVKIDNIFKYAKILINISFDMLKWGS